MPAGRLIFGGSFNPVHNGHVRVAIEAMRLLASRVASLGFLPTALPPHKPCVPMLPFDLRARMIEAAIQNLPGMSCDALEDERPGLSYTWDTLELLDSRHGSENIYFLLGSGDFELLPEWLNGLELVRRCHLVIAPRGAYTVNDFIAQARKFWPGNVETEIVDSCLSEKICIFNIPDRLSAFFLPVPWLEISATRIRKLWLCGGNLESLVPWPVLQIMKREHQIIDACWREKKC